MVHEIWRLIQIIHVVGYIGFEYALNGQIGAVEIDGIEHIVFVVGLTAKVTEKSVDIGCVLFIRYFGTMFDSITIAATI
jgi:hypothetical protein